MKPWIPAFAGMTAEAKAVAVRAEATEAATAVAVAAIAAAQKLEVAGFPRSRE